MDPEAVRRAVVAVMSSASALGLTVDDAVVVHDSNRLALRLLPCDVLARVAHDGQRVAAFEVELARQLAETRCPVAGLDPRVAPRAYERDGFAITLWTYYDAATAPAVSPAVYADALQRLHAGMRTLHSTTPHCTDRVSEAQRLVANPDLTPSLAHADRELLSTTLRRRREAIDEGGAPEQLLHGEPHPGNVLNTEDGPLFIDFETCCRGPIEFDLAHVPDAVCDRYPGTDHELLGECRGLVLAMVAAWRWQPEDRFPDGSRAGRALLRALRHGPPWPALDVVMRPPGGA
ncbi:MAG: aminoglycoside phosphotransferase family protein [Acidimicrobiales bacterium]